MRIKCPIPIYVKTIAYMNAIVQSMLNIVINVVTCTTVNIMNQIVIQCVSRVYAETI